jgi:hypothetical protein
LANSDKNILITPAVGSSTDDPKIAFQGANATVGAQTITLRVYPDNNGTLSFEGSAGQLFSITNDLTGTIFSINDVSGIPSIEVNASGQINLAQFGGNIAVGNVTPTAKLHVVGDFIVDNIDLDGNTISTLDTNGNLVLSPNGTGQVTTNTVVNATRFVSNVATGTAPFTVTSTTLVPNLNVANATYATSAGSATTATSATSATSATTAGTVTTAAQPNITSVGTLTSLGVSGAVTASTFTSNGAVIANRFEATTNGTGQNFKVGDDAYIGDVDQADTLNIRGQQNAANGYIVFGNADNTTKLGRAGSGPLTYAGSFEASGTVSATRFISNIATGTAPLAVTSTTVVTNLNADTVDGLHVNTDGRADNANEIVRTDASGYIQCGWINTTSGDNGTTAISRIYASSDGYIRYYSPANFRTVLDVPQKATTLSGYGITNGLVRGGPIGNIDYNAQRALASGIYSVDAAPTNGPPGGAYSNFIQLYERGDTSAQIVVDYSTGRMYSRGIQTATPTYSAWRTQIDDGNYNSYSPTLTGGGASGTWAISITGTANSAKYADLAERYVADKKYSPGTVLMIGGEAEVTIATKGSRTIVGTVSEHGFQMNVELEGETVVPVAYIGRVPCKVEGEVKRGDFLVVGDTPGVAVAADYSKDLTGMLIGKALEETDGTKEIIEILVGRL